MKKIQHLAIDVDDQQFHGSLLSGDGQCIEFSTPPDVGTLAKKVETIRDREAELKICYEATYVGFRLQRDLAKRGYHCDVIAPSLIPRKPGERVKTDRLDSRKLAEYYQRGLLTLVHIPDEAQEKVRGLIRSREFLVCQLKALKKHILSNCWCMGLDYRRSGTGGSSDIVLDGIASAVALGSDTRNGRERIEIQFEGAVVTDGTSRAIGCCV